MAIRKSLKRGFTLVELMIVVAIIGILAALAIYGVRRYVLNAKTSEARNTLGAIGKSQVAAYSKERGDTSVLGAGTASTQSSNTLCPDGAAVPADIPAGKKYQSAPSDWVGGWKCLMFTMETPQYYQYQFVGGTGSVGTFSAIARGDLDGDTTTSEFLLRGEAELVAGEVVLKLAPTIDDDGIDDDKDAFE